MSKRGRRILPALLLGLILAAALMVRWHGKQAARGPRYDGRRVADWVEAAIKESTNSAAAAKVIQIGAPAVPFIVEVGLQSHTQEFPPRNQFYSRHPRIERLVSWLGLETETYENCVEWHYSAVALLARMGTNGLAAIPALFECREECTVMHYLPVLEILDAIADMNGTNTTAIPYFTKCARSTNEPCALRAAVRVYEINGDAGLVVETCERLSRKDPRLVLAQQELGWYEDDQRLNQHLVPFFERLYADPRLDDAKRAEVMSELLTRSNDATAAIARLLARQTNAPAPAQNPP
jgi:hypothetical protein